MARPNLACEQQVLIRVKGHYVQPAEAEQFECSFGAELAVVPVSQ